MGLYLFLIKLYVAARLTARFIRTGDASYNAGLLALLQAAYLVMQGHAIVGIFFTGVFAYTLWLGFFNLLAHTDNWGTLPTFLMIGIAIPLLCQL